MGLNIYWTEFAEKELQYIFEYYREKASYQMAKKRIDGIYHETLKLKKQPGNRPSRRIAQGTTTKFSIFDSQKLQNHVLDK